MDTAELVRDAVAAGMKALAEAQLLQQRMWDTEDVAAFLKLNVAYVRAHIVTQSTFPAPSEIPGAKKKAIRRWRPVDVQDWAEKWRRP